MLYWIKSVLPLILPNKPLANPLDRKNRATDPSPVYEISDLFAVGLAG